jgi:hypothetical protein
VAEDDVKALITGLSHRVDSTAFMAVHLVMQAQHLVIKVDGQRVALTPSLKATLRHAEMAALLPWTGGLERDGAGRTPPVPVKPGGGCAQATAATT